MAFRSYKRPAQAEAVTVKRLGLDEVHIMMTTFSLYLPLEGAHALREALMEEIGDGTPFEPLEEVGAHERSE